MEQNVICGNNIELLKSYPDNHFDAIVTDPPYGLGKEPNAEDMLREWLKSGYMEVKGGGFMGKEWDAFVPQPIFWKEVFRVLKPGGYVLAFYGTRTYDWGVMAMRLAGFEVRDCIQYLYGVGFPKSHNISKAIDKMPKANNRLLEFAELLKLKRLEKGLSLSDADGLITGGSTMYSFLEGRNVEGCLKVYAPNKSHYEKIVEVFGLKGWDDIIENNLEVIGDKDGSFGYQKNSERWNENTKITAATTSQAKQWEGWGSALKPAVEPIVVCRKPLEKGLSIAENVLKWGVGGINIDGCRISHNEKQKFTNREQRKEGWNMDNCGFDSTKNITASASPDGRFPANIILECICDEVIKGEKGEIKKTTRGKSFGDVAYGDLDKNKRVEGIDNYNDKGDTHTNPDCPCYIMDRQSGESKSSKSAKLYVNDTEGRSVKNGASGHRSPNSTYSDKGGASRFFYQAKASKSERNRGLENERWFYNLELITKYCIFTEQNLFIWEQEGQNQSTDLNGEVQQKRDISEDIVLLASGNECCTTLYGKGIMEVFPTAIKFTTRTGISQIIELKTLNYYQHLNTKDCMADVIEMNKTNGLNLAENVGVKNLLKAIFTKGKTGFPLGVKIVVNEMQQKINVKDVWPKKNIHSTVKPVKLMQYLVRLVTPPNGLVLDPFCGSGTTGIACRLEGFNFVGMEREEDYAKIAQARIDNWFGASDKDSVPESSSLVESASAEDSASARLEPPKEIPTQLKFNF